MNLEAIGHMTDAEYFAYLNTIYKVDDETAKRIEREEREAMENEYCRY